jgi:hypothetical protein
MEVETPPLLELGFIKGNPRASKEQPYVIDIDMFTAESLPEEPVRGEKRCSFSSKERDAWAWRRGIPVIRGVGRRQTGLRVRITGSGIAHFQRPLIFLHRGRPDKIGLARGTIIADIGASVGEQRDDEPESIHLCSQARQMHLFFSQHFINVFHGPPSWANQSPKIVFA